MTPTAVRRRTGLAVLALLLAGMGGGPSSAQAPAAPDPTVVRDIAYPGAGPGDRRRSLDLYLPSAREPRPPLMIFVHGGLWRLDDDQRRIGPALAEALVQEGVAVALLRYRLAPGARHPAQAEDVAAGVALLLEQAGERGYDPDRIVLAGHAAGGHLAALVALDPSYLRRHGADPRALAGVIAFSGLFDLAPRPGIADDQQDATASAFGTDPAELARASPTRHVRAGAPPFLVLGAQSDVPGLLADAKAFADALVRAGTRRVDRWIVPDRDHFTLVRMDDPDNDARALVLDLLGVAPLPPGGLRDARRRWQDPPFSTLPFWRFEKHIRPYPVDRRLIARLLPIFSAARFELLAWPLERFHAIDLFALLDALGPDTVGRGRHLVLTNVRNEKQFWTREQIAPYQPVVVVGLDDEKNLFRLGVFYQARREYSWQDGPPLPFMARPLGAFVHFLKEPPPELVPQSAHFALTVDGFRLVATDPLAGLRGLRRDVRETLTFRNGCVYCHTFKGIGSRSHHVTAASGARHGGEALPLEAYAPDVWRAFLYDQHAVARAIGATPNPVPDPARQALYELVNASRRAQRPAP